MADSAFGAGGDSGGSPRRFAACGPADPLLHFTLPAEDRLPEALSALERGEAFVIPPARLSGRTTHLKSLASALNRRGNVLALHVPLETAAMASDQADFRRLFCARLREALADSAQEELRKAGFSGEEDRDPRLFLKPALSGLCASLPRPLALLLDDLETLPGYFLLSLLHQFRDSWAGRSAYPFPRSCVLCGAGAEREISPAPEPGLGGPRAPVDLPALPLEVPPFTEAEIRRLLALHTAEGGREYSPEAAEEAFYWSGGAPAAVGALARAVDEEILTGDHSRKAAGKDFDQAAAKVMQRREAGISGAVKALEDPAAALAFEAMVLGAPGLPKEADGEALRRARLAGLLREGEGELAPASPLVRDACLEEITRMIAYGMHKGAERRAPEGRETDMTAALKAFQGYFQENRDAVPAPFGMRKALGHLALLAFLKKTLPSDSSLLAEFGLGRGRLDLLALIRGEASPVGAVVKESETRLKEAVSPMSRYMDRCRAKEGWLVAFDPDPSVGWEKKITWRTEKHDGRAVHIVGA
ncbi:MAG: hypothetical protein LBW85_01705 [Deltaproteobacteria bacterium]|jgi:hypothetical protein|nr:hypothetical protein [Deltaproteobacteria bacterium]